MEVPSYSYIEELRDSADMLEHDIRNSYDAALALMLLPW
jgi:hypothetical protein